MPRWCASQDGPKALALTTDVTPRYCEADPFEGGKQAVAEAWRNLTAVGAPAARHHRQSQFRQSGAARDHGPVRRLHRAALREACRALDFPVVSGNVSLYNETNGRGILPTPPIGGVGLLDDFTKSATLAFKAEGEAILLIGETAGLARPVALSARDLRPRGGRAAAGRSRRREAQRRLRARPDPRGHRDRRARRLRRRARWSRSPRWRWRAASAPSSTRAAALPAHAFWFGEDQARYVVTVRAGEAETDHRRARARPASRCASSASPAATH